MIEIMSGAFEEIFHEGRAVFLDKGEHLFRSGDSVRHLYRVVEGQLALVRHTSGGDRMIIHTVVAGEIAAEASAYSAAYHCDGIAAQRLQVSGIPVAVFHERLESDSTLARHWAAHLAHATQAARTLSAIKNLRTVSERLDAWLGTGRSMPPKGEWQLIAESIGVSREALYRELAKRKL